MSRAAAPLSKTRPIPRRGLSRIESAMFFGVSPSKFDEMVKDGRAPRPRMIDARKVWDMQELDFAFDLLPHGNATIGEDANSNSWTDR